MVRLHCRDDTVMGPLGQYCCKILAGHSNIVTTICINIEGMFRHSAITSVAYLEYG